MCKLNVLINLIGGILSHCIHISKHHIVYFILQICQLYFKLEKTKPRKREGLAFLVLTDTSSLTHTGAFEACSKLW